jgi:hypothetical protein
MTAPNYVPSRLKPEVAEDRGGADGPVRGRGEDAPGIDLVELFELVGQPKSEACLDGDVLDQVGEGQFVVAPLQACYGRGEQPVGHRLVKGAAGVAEESGQPGPAQRLDGVRVGVIGVRGTDTRWLRTPSPPWCAPTPKL